MIINQKFGLLYRYENEVPIFFFNHPKLKQYNIVKAKWTNNIYVTMSFHRDILNCTINHLFCNCIY
ncbi:hypothetical protein BpHYR1_014848 [Brachionus plicatilis]|uniref:Uncharacterized protein n=1 Tax=Brachionus plicatilis TaxID=10195 RepID=A0A3M7S0W1_BRAPC|nr:hypothetical protein BpHYR1_014848 [Brachionus plicatilis]